VTAKELVVRRWRFQEAKPSGLHVWFDPTREVVRLFELEPGTEDRVPVVGERDDWDSPDDRLDVEQVVEDDLPF